MPTYSYRCADCGDFDLVTSISRRAIGTQCPTCGRDTTRRFTAPHLSTVPRSLSAAAERAGRSAESPEVVRSIPGARQPAPPVRDRRYPPLPEV